MTAIKKLLIRIGRRWLPLASQISAFLVALVTVLLWNFIGVDNQENSLHVEYSLGTSSRWHTWLDRGSPGEVVRHWGVPIYDQWSGLGYRLPVQGFLTDSPLAYLAMWFPINSVMFLGLVFSLWFCFGIVHSWVHSWVIGRPKLWCVFVDVVLVGMMSFYTIWHGWQGCAIQIAGATACVVTLTNRDNLDFAAEVPLAALFARLSLGILLLLSPHPGYGLTFIPMIVIVFLVVFTGNRWTLQKRVLNEPQVLVIPLIALVGLAGYLFDYMRESQLQKSLGDYPGEYGLIHYLFDQAKFLGEHAPFFDVGNPTTYVLGALPLLHTFIFPLLALISPESYVNFASPRRLTMSLNAYGWDPIRAQFHGGILALIMVKWSLSEAISRYRSLLRCFAIVLVLSLLFGLFTTPVVPMFWWWHSVRLTNGWWLFADVSLLATLLLTVIHGDRISSTLSSRHRSPKLVSESRENRPQLLLKVLLVAGLTTAICVLPYRITEPLRLNHGQTHYAPLQANKDVRESNESWESVITTLAVELTGNEVPVSERVIIGDGDFVGGEGEFSWWGLRTFSQLRDVQLSSVLSRPRFRDAGTLRKHAKFSANTQEFSCTSTIRSILDALSVGWAVLPNDCVDKFLRNERRVAVPMSKDLSKWTGRSRESVSPVFGVGNVPENSQYTGVRLREFHHWWARSVDSSLEPCAFLQSDCVRDLDLHRGQSLNVPPISFCARGCVARYRLTNLETKGNWLIVPLNFDAALTARQGKEEIHLSEFRGLVVIEADSLAAGEIEFSIRPDVIMRMRSLGPIAWLLTIFCVVYFNYRKFRKPTRQLTRRDF